MAKILFALAFLLLAQASYSQISLIASNATYGGTIYVLASDNGYLANGTLQIISPSGIASALALENGQAKFSATELGKWEISFMNETAQAFVYEEKTAGIPPGQTYEIGAIWFGIAISLTLALAIAFASFLLYDFMHPAYSTQKSFDGKIANASITALSRNLEGAFILFDGETAAHKAVLKKGESLSVTLECEKEPGISFLIGGKAEHGAENGKSSGAQMPMAKRALPKADS